MFPQGGNGKACISMTFPSSLQNTETRYFVLSSLRYSACTSAFPLKREKFLIVTLYSFR